MKAISLFSGVGGLDRGFELAGIETVLQAEQEPWALEVLARHWPETERVTDVRAVGVSLAGQHGRYIPLGGRGGIEHDAGGSGVDLIYGGFPCQDVSVAGKRAGLDGARSGLWFEFHRIVRELRPRWVVIENVPGLLSSNGGADFAVILAGLDELGFDAAWAVLDSQHFGVPQRRRRVFVVAGPRGRGAEQVLSLCEGCGGNPETGESAGKDVASTLRGRSHGAGVNLPGRGGEEAYGDNLVAHTLKVNTGHAHGADLETYIPIQDAREVEKHQNGIGIGEAGDPMFTIDVASRHAVAASVTSKWAKGSGGPAGDEVQNLTVANGVRRLTPLECERLQGFPDDWTRYTADGREIADSHRYRMMGNAVTVPVAQWIGMRLVAVDREWHVRPQ